MPRTRRLRWAATWLALAGSLGLGLGFVVLRAAAPSDGARVAFYGDGWSTAGIRIAPIDAPAAGLRAGDTVVGVAGRPIESWLAAALAPIGSPAAQPRPDQPIRYEVLGDAVVRSVDVRWAPPPVGATLLDGWSVVLFSIAVAAVAAFVFARRPEEPAATALVLAACGAAGSSVPWLLGVTVSDVVNGGPFLLHAIVTGPLYLVLWPAAVHLALIFPAPTAIVRGRSWAIPAVYCGAFAAYAGAMLATALVSPTRLDWVATWPTIQGAIVVPLVVLSLVIFARNFRVTHDPVLRSRIRWATLGAVTSALVGLVLFQLPELLAQRPLLPASWIGLAALPLPLGIAVGILRDRLFDIDVVVRRTLVYGGLSVGVVACYLAVVSVIGALLGGSTGYGASLFATGVAALVALPLRDLLQRAVIRLLYGERDEPVRAIRRLGERLAMATDPGLAFPAIVDTVADALRLPFVALDVVDADGALARAAERGRTPDELLTIGLVHGAEEVGRLRLGARAGERGFRPDEEHLLHDLARQAGAAIHALRLREDLARSRERLVLAREEERRRLRRDLHDGLGPSLASIGLRAEAAATMLAGDPDGARRLLEELGGEVQTTLAEVRRLVEGLRPPALDELGLVGAIRTQAGRLETAGAGIVISVDAAPTPFPSLPAGVEVAAFRIVAEALTNAIRHAAARTCRVRLSAGEELRIEVEDDGRGLPSRIVRGAGLDSMRARATELGGSIRVEPGRGGGTLVDARLPVSGPGARSVFAPEGAPGTAAS
jgi:signal transduction histidine kinase